MNQAIAYLRVSTSQQAESQAGLNAQLDACNAYAERNGLQIEAVMEDKGISGSKGLEERPGLLEAVSLLRKGDVLLVAKRDRLGRDPIAVAMIEAAISRKKARVVSTMGEGTDSDNPTDILMRRMVDAFAEYERLIIGARTKAALKAKKARGERVGKIPFGWNLASDGKTLLENPQEQKSISLMQQLRRSGMSIRQIAAELDKRGISTKNGNGKWTPKVVWTILEKAA